MRVPYLNDTESILNDTVKIEISTSFFAYKSDHCAICKKPSMTTPVSERVYLCKALQKNGDRYKVKLCTACTYEHFDIILEYPKETTSENINE